MRLPIQRARSLSHLERTTCSPSQSQNSTMFPRARCVWHRTLRSFSTPTNVLKQTDHLPTESKQKISRGQMPPLHVERPVDAPHHVDVHGRRGQLGRNIAAS